MLSAERKLKIAEIISKNDSIKTSEISSMFDVSEMTVLRDLALLEEQGILKRVYGGAVLLKNTSREVSNVLRQKINISEKNTIAQKAEKLIREGDSIFLDGSSTSLVMAKKLYKRENITLITNGLDVVNEISKNSKINIICTGGELEYVTMNFVGPDTEKMIKDFNVNKSFISPAGISQRAGLTVESPRQALIKRTMIKNSESSVLLADYSKFDRITLNKVCEFDIIDIIITDRKPKDNYLKLFKKNNIKVLY